MTDPFDDLERELRAAVRRAPAAASRRVRRGSRRAAMIAVAATLTVGGGAVAGAHSLLTALHLAGGPSAETQGRRIAEQALRATLRLPACTPPTQGERQLVDGAPLREITTALPALAEPSSADEQARTLTRLRPAPAIILRSTLRTIRMPGGVTLVVYVERGNWLDARDPAACSDARRAVAERLLRGRSQATRRAADRRLAQLSPQGIQTLWVDAHVAGHSGSGGAGAPVRPGRPLRPGLLLSGGGLYVGIADPRAATVAVGTRRVEVRQGLFAVRLPKGTGPVSLRERDRAGAAVRTLTLRR